MSARPHIFDQLRRLWVCPNCTHTWAGTATAAPFHVCAGLRGLTAPLVVAGTDCEVVTHEREDYVNKERLTVDGDGRPVMSVETRHADGSNDIAVYAPLVQVVGEVG